MSDVITEYQKWKQQGDDLRLKAKQAMELRFHELLTEAARLADEYREDFGSGLKPPSFVTAFRYKTPSKKKSSKPAKSKAPVAPPTEKVNPKVPGIQKRLILAKRKLEEAKTAGKATRPLEDKIYELEDELRLASQPH